MKRSISIPHDTYMMTIHQVVQAIQALTNGTVVSLTEDNGNLTFTLEYNEPSVDLSGWGVCPSCGHETELNEMGYCFRLECS